MASANDVIHLLEQHVFLTTQEIDTLLNARRSYPLIRLVQKGVISCVLASGRQHYFLEKNRHLLPTELQQGKKLEGTTQPVIIPQKTTRPTLKLNTALINKGSSPVLSLENNARLNRYITSWTDQEIELLIDNYLTGGLPACQKVLNRGPRAIRLMAGQLGLRRIF